VYLRKLEVEPAEALEQLVQHRRAALVLRLPDALC